MLLRERILPRKLECIFPPSLFWALYKDPVQSNYNLRKCRPNNSFHIPALLNQPVLYIEIERVLVRDHQGPSKMMLLYTKCKNKKVYKRYDYTYSLISSGQLLVLALNEGLRPSKHISFTASSGGLGWKGCTPSIIWKSFLN